MNTQEELVQVKSEVPDSGKEAITMQASPQRLYSLDALRGFDMVWIMGAEEIFHELAKNYEFAVLEDYIYSTYSP